ncbi:hypothetical protein BJ138DRAFT_1094993 [Hygrophoropsis aurantiaca]|uniref:Uncharacterized protein n=1 Tax=Hygrophoropsis aurantiaca TaxID=72124 RepID=A0ACB7ZWU3_9AGAM|nr:hypothetical protein BJ138DRAFT_1094993 [Hygrophoropsis aurantiaca]
MLLKLENSPDPVTRKLRQQYASPLKVGCAVQKVIDVTIQNSPLRLIETATGWLCDRDERINAFKRTPDFKELISSMTTDATFDHERIAEVVKKYFRNVMLSHRWEGKEPLLREIRNESVYDLKSVDPAAKLRRFCRAAHDAGYKWAWSETCCIDRTNSVELQQSLNSMFDWYRDSSLIVVYLSDVLPSSKPGALTQTAWTKRGWTLQEFIAPKVIRFFAKDWTPYLNDFSLNHKESTVIMRELEGATSIAEQALVDFRPGTTDVRQKLQWVSTRITTEEEDVAYSLFGIFNVKLAVIYGENKQHALGRLLEAIVSRSGDITALNWVGQSSEYNSCLPADITVYEAPACAPPPVSRADMETLASGLQSSGPAEMALALYDKLNRLGLPGFANHRLTLPCIVFPLTALSKRTDGRFGSEDVEITTTADMLFLLSSARRELPLVRPWNRDLLADIESEVQNTADVTPSNAIRQGPSLQSSPESDTLTEALILVSRLKQQFVALLLVRERGREYRRIASDHDIIAQVRDINKIMDVRSIEIL